MLFTGLGRLKRRPYKYVAIFGSRDFPDLDLVREYVRTLPRNAVVVSGGARGVDRAAEYEAKRLKLPEPLIHLAEWDLYGKKAGFLRNKLIVRDADEGMAFWDGVSNGTWDTYQKMLEAGKDCFMVIRRA